MTIVSRVPLSAYGAEQERVVVIHLAAWCGAVAAFSGFVVLGIWFLDGVRAVI